MWWRLTFLLPLQLFATTLWLINDSHYDLYCIVRGGDGTLLGQLSLKAQNQTTWSQAYGKYGDFKNGKVPLEQADRSMTPYTVHWYCATGEDFSICTMLQPGTSVSALQCQGAKQCKREKPKPGEKPPTPPGTFYEEGQPY